jgi:tellurite resistance protein TehA-like permease
MALRSDPALLTRRVMRRAVLVTLALAVPPVLIVRILKGGDLAGRESNLWLVAVGVMLIAYAIGGAVASAASEDLHLSHSAGAATYAFFVMAVGSIVVALAYGSRLDTAFGLGLLMLGTLCVCFAVLGGYAAMQWSERRR